MQVIQKHAEEFLEKMNSEVITAQLRALALIPERVERGILNSKSRKDANALLLNYLKEESDEEAIMKTFRIASKEAVYPKMNTFAIGILRELQ